MIGLLSAGVLAQQEAPPTVNVPYEHDSGWFENTSLDADVVLSFPVHLEGASWMRLYFEEISLSGELSAGTGAILRMTALEDGGIQEMNAAHVGQWQNSSAYFNGDTVLVEVLAFPGSGWNRVAMRSIDMGVMPASEPSICGPSDDRVLSSDARVARILPVGCTGWMIDDCGRCFLTAGHCAGSTGVAQFNVPLSSSGGGLNHPPPSDQYSVDGSSMQTNGGQGVGNDWAHFGCFPNSNTGMTPAQAQGSVFTLVSPPGASGTNIRITGHGVDNGNRNQVQQTHVGPASNLSGNSVSYVTDTQGGNSGSPVIWDQTDQAVGIHTHGGCGSSGGSNNGTSSVRAELQDAINNPMGVCTAGWSFPTAFPELVPPGVPVPLQVQLLGSGSSVTLHYRINGGAFQPQAMVPLGGGIYEGTLPMLSCGDSPEYYFSYVDASCGLANYPDDAPASSLSMEVGSPEPVLSDNFESDQGWTTTINGATSGAWERGVPVNDPNYPYDPPSDSDGSGSCYLTGNSLGESDVDNGSVSLISPVLDFSLSGSFVSYDYYLRMTTGIGNDNLKVEARNGSGPWLSVATHAFGSSNNWRSNSISALEFASAGVIATSNVQLRFTVSDLGTITINEAGLDNFFVGRIGCGADLGTNYCSSTGAVISASGSDSVADNNLTLRADNLPAMVNGIFFYGDLQNSVPLGNGTLCVSGTNGIFRFSPVQNSGLAGQAVRAVDLNNPPLPAGQVTAGSTWNYQFWFRENGSSNLTDAVSIIFTP
jgi:hypothetical protein